MKNGTLIPLENIPSVKPTPLVKDYKRDFGGEVTVEEGEYSEADDCQTPPYALAAIAPYLSGFSTAWEPASGEGILAQAIRDQFGFEVIETGIEENFFQYEPCGYDIQISNSPWSKKYEWLERSLLLEQPFALLLPSKMLFAARAIHLIETYNLEIIQVYPRVGYKMITHDSFLESRPQLDSCWLTWGLRVGRRLTYVDIGQEKKRFLAELRAKEVGQMVLF